MYERQLNATLHCPSIIIIVYTLSHWIGLFSKHWGDDQYNKIMLKKLRQEQLTGY